MNKEMYRIKFFDIPESEFSYVTLDVAQEEQSSGEVLNTYTVTAIEGNLPEANWVGKSFTKTFSQDPGDYGKHSSYEHAVGRVFRDTFMPESVLQFEKVSPSVIDG